MISSIAAVAMTMMAAVPGMGDLVLDRDGGGDVAEYQQNFYLMSGTVGRVVIDGECFSACTLALSKEYRLPVCATERAVLGFHKPYMIDRTGKVATGAARMREADMAWRQLWLKQMPDALAAKLATIDVPSAAAGANTQEMATLRAPNIFKYVPKCEGK